MENKKQNKELKKMPLIFSLTKTINKEKLELEMKKISTNKKYNAEHYPIYSHFKSIIRF